MDIISSDNEQLRKDDILWRIFAGTLQVSCNFKNDAFVFGLDGKCLITASKNEYDFCIDIKGLYNGVYLLVLRDSRSGVLKTIRFAKKPVVAECKNFQHNLSSILSSTKKGIQSIPSVHTEMIFRNSLNI